MPLSIYEVATPVFVRGLQVLLTSIEKAQAHVKEAGLKDEELIGARLAPDMMTFAQQIQRASDTAKFAVVRLTGQAGPSFPDTETTFDELRQRVSETLAFLNTVAPEAFDGAEEREIVFGPDSKWVLKGDAYLLRFALPNFFFHVTTAHDILRSRGVAIGKRDYLGPLDQG